MAALSHQYLFLNSPHVDQLSWTGSQVLGLTRSLQVKGSFQKYVCRPYKLKAVRAAILTASDAEAAQAALLEGITGVKGRGRGASEQQKKDIAQAVEVLENAGGIPQPTESELIEGRWQLVYTTRPGTASPIQRTFVGVDAFSVFQEIQLRGTSDPRVTNIVDFSEKFGQLKVEASASIANEKRINFKFDRAAFQLKFWPYRVPYPVPFRLLGDEAKGWLDTTYLAPTGDLRISRGNKGTAFVLQKNPGPRQCLLMAIGSKRGIFEAVEELASVNPTSSPADSSLLDGKWRLIWSSQASDANRLQQLSAGIASNWQVIQQEIQRLENVVEILPGLRLRAGADTKVVSPTRTEVQINSATVEIGGLKVPLNIKGEGWIEQLYLDDTLRISRGNKGSTFVHVREEGEE